jgi:hypothetical protein
MFAIDKVLHMVEPPLQDIWYMIVLALAVWVEPSLILNYFKKWK